MPLAFWLSLPLRLAGVAPRVRQPLPPSRPATTPGPDAFRPLARKQPAPPRLEVEVHDTGLEVVARLRGEAGVPEAAALEASLLRLAARRPACVRFDLSELAFISSLAMGALVSYRRGAVRAGTRVCLSPELRPAVREALERAGLMELFETPGGAAPRYPRLEDVQRTQGVTWPQLVELEPEVEALLWRARQVGARCQTLPDA